MKDIIAVTNLINLESCMGKELSTKKETYHLH